MNVDGPRFLLRWRMKHAMSQDAAATQLGVSQGLYSGWEAGKKTPTIVNLGRIRRETGISLEAWLPKELRLPELVVPALAKPAKRTTRRPPAKAA